jgi:hypothetical protein
MKTFRNLLAGLLILCPAIALALAPVSKPYTFSSGTKVSSAEVNSDFDNLYTGMNTIISAINAAAGSRTTLDTRLDASFNEDGTPKASVFATAAQGAKADTYTAADALAKIITVDGTGSGLDADLLDGQHAAAFTPIAGWATGTPIAPTAATGTQTTQIATTAFVDPAHSFATNGYQRFASGLIVQWGYSATNYNVTFPITFPNACFFVSVTTNRSGTTAGGANYAKDITTVGFTATFDTSVDNGWWMAIGY